MKIKKSYLKSLIKEVLLEVDLSDNEKSAAGFFKKHHEIIDKMYKDDPNNFKKNVINFFTENMPVGHGISQKWFDNMVQKILKNSPLGAYRYCYNFYLKGSGSGV